MNKEKFMEFVSKAFDNDAKIELMFYSDDRSEDSAKVLADEFAEITSGEVKEVYSGDLKTRWFKVYSSRHQLDVFHKDSDDRKYFNLLNKEAEAI